MNFHAFVLSLTVGLVCGQKRATYLMNKNPDYYKRSFQPPSYYVYYSKDYGRGNSIYSFGERNPYPIKEERKYLPIWKPFQEDNTQLPSINPVHKHQKIGRKWNYPNQGEAEGRPLQKDNAQIPRRRTGQNIRNISINRVHKHQKIWSKRKYSNQAKAGLSPQENISQEPISRTGIKKINLVHESPKNWPKRKYSNQEHKTEIPSTCLNIIDIKKNQAWKYLSNVLEYILSQTKETTELSSRVGLQLIENPEKLVIQNLSKYSNLAEAIAGLAIKYFGYFLLILDRILSEVDALF